MENMRSIFLKTILSSPNLFRYVPRQRHQGLSLR